VALRVDHSILSDDVSCQTARTSSRNELLGLRRHSDVGNNVRQRRSINRCARLAAIPSQCWGVSPINQSLKFRDTQFLAFLQKMFHGLNSIFGFAIRLRISWRGGGMIERPALRKCFELFIRKPRTIVSNQNLRYAETWKNWLHLANHGFCLVIAWKRESSMKFLK